MAFHVVIVEDNIITCRSLVQTVNWASLDCEIVGTAQDGISGEHLIRRLKPEIVLTDVCMPGENGLDMIENIQKEQPECKIIVISGYDRFQFASRAIKLGVYDYLLKPINNEELALAIKRITMRSNTSTTEGQTSVSDILSRRRAQLFCLLTNDGQRGQGVHDMLANVGLEFDMYYIMVVQLQQEQVYSQAFINRIDTLLDRLGKEATTLFLYDAVVIFITHRGEQGQWGSDASLIADTLMNEVAEDIHIGISTLGTSRHAIRPTYLQARRALWEIALKRHKRKRNFYELGNTSFDDQTALPSARLKELIDSAELTEASATHAAEILTDLSGGQSTTLRSMLGLYAMALRNKFAAPDDEKAEDALSEVWFVEDEQSAASCLARIVKIILDCRKEHENHHLSLMTRNALQYIRLHAAEGISLSDVADKLCVTSNYLSSRIKQETGINFHDHILDARISMARKLLADPRVLVEEVAQAVGYSNYISFYNAFKRKEHMSPTEYRNQKVGL